jgi:hypothetical protein
MAVEALNILIPLARNRVSDGWARADLNHRIPGYEPGALTRLSYGPAVVCYPTVQLNSIASVTDCTRTRPTVSSVSEAFSGDRS